VKYELSFYIPEDGILYSVRHENLKFYLPPFVSVHVRRMAIAVPPDGLTAARSATAAMSSDVY
jgi:hypothetical protein